MKTKTAALALLLLTALAVQAQPAPVIQPGYGITNSQFRFSVGLTNARGYVVEIATNMPQWRDYHAFFSFTNTYDFLDTNAAGTGRRFYRVTDRTGAMPPPANDDFANRFTVAGLGSVFSGYNAGATAEPEEYGAQTAWWRWTAPLSGKMAVLNVGSTFNPVIRVYFGSGLDDLFLIAEGTNQVTFTAALETDYYIQADQGQDGATGGIRLLITAMPSLTVSSPTNNASLIFPTNITLTASASDADGSIVSLNAYTNGVLFHASAGGVFSQTWTNAPRGTNTLHFEATDNWGAVVAANLIVNLRPVNDSFSAGTEMAGTNITAEGSNVGATKETGEPSHGANNTAQSVWWFWTAPSTGTAVVHTVGSTFDTLLAVYTNKVVSTNNTFTNLALVAANDDTGFSTASQVSFAAAAGKTYYIAVDGSKNSPAGNQGDVVLTLQMNVEVPSVSVVSPGHNSVFVGPGTNIPVSVNASGAGGISRVELYKDYALAGTLAAAPYDFVLTNTALGTYILAAKAVNNQGIAAYSVPVTIQVIPPAPANDAFAARTVIPGTNTTVTGTTVSATKETNEPNHAGNPGGRSVWWSWSTPAAGLFAVMADMADTNGNYVWPVLNVYRNNSITTLTNVANDWPYYGNPAMTAFSAAAGTNYQIAVDTDAAVQGNVTLKVIPIIPTVLSSNVPLAGLSGTARSVAFYRFTLPTGRPSVTMTLSGGVGDADMYVRRGTSAPATLSTYGYQNVGFDNNETVTVSSPGSGDWYVTLYGASAYSNATLTVTW